MSTPADKTPQNKPLSISNDISTEITGKEISSHFADNRSEAAVQKKMDSMVASSFHVKKSGVMNELIGKSAHVKQLKSFQQMANNSFIVTQINAAPGTIQRSEILEEEALQPKSEPASVNKTGLPDNLKSGIENLSGYSMEDVKVHYNSDRPAPLQAHAYAEGADIHLGPGQEKHLPHEAWHVAQQKQGRVSPTKQLKGKVNINDDEGLEKEADVMGAKALQQSEPQSESQLSKKRTLRNKPVQAQLIQRNPTKAVARRGVKGAAGGLVVGGLIGFFVPGIGTLLGFGIGAASGLLLSLIKEAFEVKARKRIAEHYGIELSSDISGFILGKIESVLESLPIAHTKGNPILTHVNTEGVGNASMFDNDHTIGIHNPGLPIPGEPDMPDFLYAMLTKEYGWQRKLMDQGAMPEFREAVDRAYGLNSDDRHVMAGVSDANSHENLLTWTMRHEIGHSVDAQIGWASGMKGQPVCGGWQEHTQKHVFLNLLEKNNITANIYNTLYQLNSRQLIPLHEELIGLTHQSVGGFLTSQKWLDLLIANPAFPDDINQRLTGAIRSFDIAKNHPWTFDDGGVNDLSFNDRIYMRGQYGDWESYLATSRAYAVSNYQFSSAVEWFAEAYAAYYNPEPNAASLARLSPDQRAWFETTLGTHSNDANFNQARI